MASEGAVAYSAHQRTAGYQNPLAFIKIFSFCLMTSTFSPDAGDR